MAKHRSHRLGGTALVGQKPDANFIWSITTLLRGPCKPNK